ncbi:MAG: PhoH family protein [Candidatus Omnitrophica bacterium]|nr:PhoH family protein [Candidatus Omnitrophota bacterium]
MDKLITLHTHQEAQAILGPCDENLRRIEKEFKVKIAVRGENIKISGTAVNIKKASAFIESFLESLRSGKGNPGHIGLDYLMADFAKAKRRPGLSSIEGDIFFSSSGKRIGPRTKGQKEYVEAIRKYDIVFGLGPAGTGKTYLAMASAVEALKKQQVRRIILTRPAIEAGESLGFLPGDMYEKISPYLRPLYDALYDMVEGERIEKYLEAGIIEVAPLAYMRGRTLNDAFIILDEAQNCTAEQMKMFLTRLGFDSRAVVTGDMTQSDLPDGKPIGLLQAQDILGDILGIKFIYFTGFDVVRHPLVQTIIEAYDKSNHQK